MKVLVPGVRVEWDTWCGVAEATVTFVDAFHVTLVSPQGRWSTLDATCFRSLEEATAHLRPVAKSGDCGQVQYHVVTDADGRCVVCDLPVNCHEF